MPDSRYKMRLSEGLDLVGTLAAIVSYTSMMVFILWPSLFQGLIALAIALCAMGIFLGTLRGSRLKRLGATTNTQLQQRPPAIVQGSMAPVTTPSAPVLTSFMRTEWSNFEVIQAVTKDVSSVSTATERQ